jgi:hypothetical protein
MTTPIRPDTSRYGPPEPYRPDTSRYGPPEPYTAATDASRMAGSSGTGKMTWEQATRAAAAGILPGISDNLIAFFKAARNKGKPFAEMYAEAHADERRLLDEARTMAGSGALENLSAVVSGAGLAKLATRGVPVVSKIADFLVGGISKGAPSTLPAAFGQGWRGGSRIGAIAGAGNADDGNLLDRALGGLTTGIVGGVAGGLGAVGLTAAANRLAPAQLNAADAAQAFPLGTPAKAQRQAIGEASDAMRRGGVDVGAAREAAAGMEAAGVNPLLADVGGPAMLGDIGTIDALSQTRGAGASKVYKEPLTGRAKGRSGRQAAAVASATERPTVAVLDYIKKLEGQKSALDDIMFDRFRRAAEAKGPTRAGRLRTPDQLKKTLMDPKFFNAAVKLEEEMVSNQAAGVAGKYVSPFKPVLDGDGVPTGEFEVKDFLDPVTLSELSRVLGGMREEAYAAAGNARLARAPAAAKQQIDDLLSTIPEFKEANRVSRRMHQRIEATKQGYQRALADEPSALATALRKYDGPTIALPKDVRDFLASGAGDVPEVLRGRNAIGPAKSDFEAGAQAARVKPIRRAKDPTKMNGGVSPEVDQTLFGPDAAAKIQAANDAEAIAMRTERASPTAQDRIAPNKGVSPESRAIEGVTAALRQPVRYQGGATGIALGLMDAGSRAARFGVPMSPERMADIARGQMAPANAGLNLIDQLRAASNTPTRRGLIGGAGYMAGGLFGDNRNR